MTWARIGFGTSPYRAGGARLDLELAVTSAARAGYRLFDVAEMYGNERAVGRALRTAGVPRGELSIVGKAWRTSFRPQHLRAACEASLRRLGVPFFDAYLLHAPEAWRHVAPLDELDRLGRPEFERRLLPRDAAGSALLDSVPLAETWGAMQELKRAGLARRIGVSNFAVAQLEGLGDVVPEVNEIACSPLQPQCATVRWCAERGTAVLAHSPLSAGETLAHPVIRELALARGVPAAQLVLAWQRERGVVPLPSSSEPAHIVENLASLAVTLDAATLRALDALGSPDLTLPEGAP